MEQVSRTFVPDGSYEDVLKLSQAQSSSKMLLEILESNILKFLKTLQSLKDEQASVLVNVLQFAPDKSHWILQVLNKVKEELRVNDPDIAEIKFYCQVYLSLVSEFKIVYPSHLEVLLNYLSKDDGDIQATILFIVVQSIELDKLASFESITNFFDFTLETESDFSSFTILIKSLELLFPIVPAICTKIYTSNTCKDIIVAQVQRITPSSISSPNIHLLAKNLLLLVSSSCIDDECRTFNANTYIDLLKVGTEIQLEDIRLPSVLCIVKLWNFLKLSNQNLNLTVDQLLDIDLQYLTHRKSDDNLEYCVEAMAYLTLNTLVKQRIRDSVEVIEAIILLLKSKTETQPIKSSHSSMVYGLLLILTNLMKLKLESESQEKKTISYLKLVADPSKEKSVEDPQLIHNFNKSLLMDYKIIEIIIKLKIIKKSNSTNSDQLIDVIYYISCNQNKTVRQELVKQGSLNILLDYLVLVSSVNSSGITRPLKESTETRMNAIRALAKILVMVNPALAFNKYSIATCIPFLIELMGPDISKYTGLNTSPDKYLYDEVTQLDKYESLMALTNISAIPDDKNDVKGLIITKSFPYLDNFIIDSDSPMIQKAAWELISNLITKPALLVKFFNMEDSQAKKRLTLLLKLLESTDLLLQVILAGLLANATSEFEMIPQLIMENEPFGSTIMETITRIFNNQTNDQDLILRLCYVTYDLVSVSKSITEDLKKGLSKVLQLRDPLVIEVVVEILKIK